MTSEQGYELAKQLVQDASAQKIGEWTLYHDCTAGCIYYSRGQDSTPSVFCTPQYEMEGDTAPVIVVQVTDETGDVSDVVDIPFDGTPAGFVAVMTRKLSEVTR